MRVKRVLLAIAMIGTGAVIARPDDLLPLASKLAAPLMMHHDAQPSETVAPSLPRFVNATRDLSIPVDATPAAGAAPPSTAPQAVPAETAAAAPAGTVTAAVETAPAATDVAPAAKDDTAGDGGTDAPAEKTDVAPADSAGPHAETQTDTAAADATKTEEFPLKAPNGKPLVPAKALFGAAKGPSLLQARSIGSYARGCLAGAAALPVDGPAWQAMRLSRNRNWGHPKLVDLVEKLATTAQKEDGWPGLLVGDLSQPRGGPMLTGHASHQVGLDADVWLTPMPDHKLTRKEREDIAATSMLDSTDLAVDPKVFTEKHVKLIKRAASFPEVERVLVHPAIKKALCQAAGTDRRWLGKVRPIQGHYYHMHIRISCPPGSVGCEPQKPVTGEDGCTKEVDEWLQRMARNKLPAPPKPPGWKPSPPRPPLMLTQLPADCRMVLESGADGVNVPPEALVAAVPVKRHGKSETKAANVMLRPAKERRAQAH